MPIAQPRFIAGNVGLSPVDLDNARRMSPVRVASKVETGFVVATPAWLEWERDAGHGLGIDWIDLVAPDGTLTTDLQLTDGTTTETLALGFVGPATGGRKFLEFPGALLIKPDVTVRFRFPDAVAGMRYSVLASIFRWRSWQ